ncbi:hypothetical protein, partial [Mycobacterium sp.]|uniref:hypothetical protein n=1 Tax=Mycobacterium sp. TaxID=1785 RepID=UPI003F94C849
MDLLGDLVKHRQADEVVRDRQPEPGQRERRNLLGRCPGVAFVWGYFELDPSPRHTVEQHGHVGMTL